MFRRYIWQRKKDELDYDVRIVDRSIREGLVSKKEYDKYIQRLPDVEEKGEPLVFEDEIEPPEAEVDQAEDVQEKEEEDTQ